MKKIISIFFAFIFLYQSNAQETKQLPLLKVSENGRYLVQNNENKSPFFWLGDTGWKIHRLSIEDIKMYLETRSSQGFNVIQGPVIVDFDKQGNLQKNGQDIFPLNDPNNLTTFNIQYLEHFRYILKKADSLGIYVCLLPFWAQGLNKYPAPHLTEFGIKLSNYFQDCTNLIWCIAGEAAGESTPEQVEALAIGLRSGKQLITVHPSGSRSSSQGEYWVNDDIKGKYSFHNSSWLDFNMLQSGHRFDFPNYVLIQQDYQLKPNKPTLESENFYEDHAEWDRRNDTNPPRATDLDVRKGAYWSVFAGGFGFTYGHHAVWQVYTKNGKGTNSTPTVDWKTALNAPGANQMKHLKNLMYSFSYLNRIPDQSLLTSHSDTAKSGAVIICRDSNINSGEATYIMAYLPSRQSITLSTKMIKTDKLNIQWFDPRNGNYIPYQTNYPNSGSITVESPTQGPDYVLVVQNVLK